ncbi:MAG TPA: prephenate dehydratase [Alphaproteobacteria bacterium]
MPQKTTPTLSFQGALGAYSHLACDNFKPGCQVLPCVDFASAIRAVHEGQADLACLPVDNSIAGRVADMHHLLPDSQLQIVAETFIPIEHCVMSVKGATLKGIQHVHSHVHALPQCRQYIKKQGWQAHVASDTAAAAEMVAEKGDPTQAAIASRIAAGIYGLDILAENVADAAHNTTRFVLMAPMANKCPLPDINTPCLTSFVFQVRSIPAALYKALGGFATNGLNLVKIESYMIDGDFAAARFYAEVEGHPLSKSMQLALEELGFYADAVHLLGTYAQHAFRQA